MNISWIFFDIGGVLSDETWILDHIFNVAKKYRPDITMEQIKDARIAASSIVSSLNQNTLRFLLTEQDQENALRDWEEIWAHPSRREQQKIRAEAKDVIEKLSKKYNLGIIANQHKTVKEKLETAGIYQYFKHGKVSHDYNMLKPDPEFFKAVMNEVEANPDTSAIIDDNLERSIIPAKNLGMTTVWYNLDNRVAPEGIVDFEIKALADLLRIF